ncbi:MAG: GNAT family N-acetyltransferase [Myxococcota bacterium]
MADVEIAEGVAALPRDEWNALVADESPFLEWDWLASLEDAGTLTGTTGWLSQPLVVRENGRILAACPLYVKGHSQGEFVFDWGWADAAEQAGIRYYPKLLVGVPFTPVTGARFLVAPGEERKKWVRILSAALREICVGQDMSSVHVNFCLPEELETLEDSGFLARVGIQYHWKNEGYENFGDYLSRFRSKRRNQIKREQRQLAEAGVSLQALAGDEIPDDLFSPMYDFYLSTIENRSWGRQYLNYELFEAVRNRFRNRLVFIVAFQNGEPIAGTFNVAKGDALYGRYWGTLRYVRHLHFNVCYYAAVDYCIRNGISRFEPGAGGEYKQLRGFDAQPTYSAHFLADARLSRAVGDFLERERVQSAHSIEWIRNRSALKPSGS